MVQEHCKVGVRQKERESGFAESCICRMRRILVGTPIVGDSRAEAQRVNKRWLMFHSYHTALWIAVMVWLWKN